MALRSPFRSFARLLHTHPPRLQERPAGQNGAGALKSLVDDALKGNYSTDGALAKPTSMNVENGTFLRPFHFHRQYQSKNAVRKKRPYLGPGRAARETDVFLQQSIDPRLECQNSNLMSYFVTSMGKIKSRADTHLTTRSQRLLTKAIKRARMMGVIPRFSRRTLAVDYIRR